VVWPGAATADGTGDPWTVAWPGAATADGTRDPVHGDDAGGGQSRRGMDGIMPSPMWVGGARMWGRGVVGEMYCGAWPGRRG
jgi:hypothetical protein